jgi:hypothetical protein
VCGLSSGSNGRATRSGKRWKDPISSNESSLAESADVTEGDHRRAQITQPRYASTSRGLEFPRDIKLPPQANFEKIWIDLD